ncbi:hybrid sensor histidine kinase/response regulator [Granulosicoccus antarcticus]|uniref:histidine kinase n=1 Tax=Granulosicoccus antarcticus IMCC3135 TaxID=1192854 RepID=A0A2Z2NWU8_9GAMM|nr:hybrid sensor histidine kinase/response regulator [Granulosicoccus antarcticus]ASJ75829.1 Sensor histidine kinase RcsC [Granulosicoccus antarcticus IMCC3135]
MHNTLKTVITQRHIEPRVAVEAIDFVYANLIDVSRLQVLFPLIIAVLYWPLVSHSLIVVWCIASISIYLARIFLALAYKRKDPDNYSPYRWGLYFTATCLVSGLLWGTSGWLFFVPDAESQQTILYVLIVGTAAGAIIISSYWMIGYLAYAIPAISLLSLNLFFRGDVDDAILGGILFLYLGMVIGVARKVRVQAYSGINLRFDNLDLVEQLREQKLEAERSNRAKTQFLAAANHDLRQPVHALSLLSYSIKSELDSDRGKSLYIHLSQAIDNLSSLLSSLLDLSQLDAGAMKVQLSEFSVASIAASVQSEYQSLAEARNITLKVIACRGGVSTDFVLLRRLIGNLVSNAIRHTHAGGVLVAFRHRGEKVLVQVWDTGIGIPESEHKEIFREFYQVANPQRNSENGLGLGLAICTRIANLLHTTLTLKSQVDKGTLLSFCLPSALTTIDRADEVIHFDTDILTHKTVLLIDDDLTGLNALSSVLTQHGMRVTQSESYERAEELVFDVGLHPDIIVSDFRLAQQTNGIELINRLRQHPALVNTPAILITGDTAVEVLRQLQNSEIPVINKPVSANTLLPRIHDLLIDSNNLADEQSGLRIR